MTTYTGTLQLNEFNTGETIEEKPVVGLSKLGVLEAGLEMIEAKEEVRNVLFDDMDSRYMVRGTGKNGEPCKHYVILVKDVEPFIIGMIFGNDPHDPHTWAGKQSDVQAAMADFCRERWNEITKGVEMPPEDSHQCITDFTSRHSIYRYNYFITSSGNTSTVAKFELG